MTVNLTGWLQTCQAFRLEMNVKINGYSLKVNQRTESGSRLTYPLDGAKNTVSEVFSRAFCRAVDGKEKQSYGVVFFLRDLF